MGSRTPVTTTHADRTGVPPVPGRATLANPGTRRTCKLTPEAQQESPAFDRASWIPLPDAAKRREEESIKFTSRFYMKTEYGAQAPTFTALPNWLRGKTTPLEGWLLWTLQSHYPNIFPSLSLLAKEACMSRRAVCNVLADMERKGWVVRERSVSDAGRKVSTRYSLTIWDGRWGVVTSAGGALVHEVHQASSASGALGLVHEVHGASASGALKEDQEKKNKKKKEEEPPLPPVPVETTDARIEPGLRHDQDGFLVNPCSAPLVATQPQPQQSVPPWGPAQPKPAPEPEPAQPAAKAPRTAKPKTARFEPTADDIPAVLLPVQTEILIFWTESSGKKTAIAWNRLIGQLRKIQDDSQGGTEILRDQLEEGAARGWEGITHANWERFGKRAATTPMVGSGFRGRHNPDEQAAAAVAFIRERDRRRAMEQEGSLALLAEVV